MRNLKKFLALVMAMVMAMSLMVTANAASDNVTFPDDGQVTPEFQEAVTVLAGMKVFQGDNGNFKPSASITRAEAAAVVYRLVTADVTDSQAELYRNVDHPFYDVTPDKWYAGYVGFLWNKGIIKGTSEHVFDAKSNVTGYQVLAMILRAVGYGQNGEFEGTNWVTPVAATAQVEGILTDVNKTNYSGATLYNAARRDVVASLLFRTAAYVPQVQYTAAFQYQKYGMDGGVLSGKLNPTLGEQWFGLTCNTGAIVGNEATGEDYTMLGMEAVGQFDSATTPNLIGVEITDKVSYAYDTTNGDSSMVKATPTGNVTLTFDFNTGLEWYGHKANVWYDSRTSTGTVIFSSDAAEVKVPTAYAKTYAVIDKATLTATVFARGTNLQTAGAAQLRTPAATAGFSVNNSSVAYYSDRYSQFNTTTAATGNASKVGMYALISNSAGKSVDVVIALNEEVARITQVNSTVAGSEYIYLGTGSSLFGDQLASTGNKGLILFDQLSEASDKTLGDVVTANQIVGSTVAFDDADSANSEDCLYQTDKLTSNVTGTVSTYKLADPTDSSTRVMSVTLTTGDTLDLSGITGADVNTTAYPWNFDSATHLIDGALTTLTGNNTYAGVTYTYFKDEVGRFIGVGIPDSYSFLYATYADYEIGGLGDGSIKYAVTGVDWNGEKVINHALTGVRLPVWDDSGVDKFDDNTANSGTATSFTGSTLYQGYNLLPITKKDQGTAEGGNRIRPDANTRFMINEAGFMSWYDRETELYSTGNAKYGTRFEGWYDEDNSTTVNNWTITSADVSNGFKRVYDSSTAGTPGSGDNVDYLLTNDTKFIVVTGAGTSDLTVTPYKGMKGLVGDAGRAIIHYDGGDNIYFLTSAERFGNVNTTDNATIDTVILSNTNLTRYSNQTVYFSAPGNAPTGVKLTSASGEVADVYQYTLFNNGVKNTYFIQGGGTDGSLFAGYDADDPAAGKIEDGTFYDLVPLREVNGITIYQAVPKTSGCDVDVEYKYIVVNNLSTAEIGSKIYKVDGAVVAEAYGTNADSLTITPNTIDSVLKLNNAVSMGKPGASGDLYDVIVAIVYSGVNVSCIYVTNITDATT